MKRLLVVVALAFVPGMASAQSFYSSQSNGPFTYYQGTDQNGQPWSGTSQQLGPYRYYWGQAGDGQMTNCMQQRLGQFTYTNCQ